MLCDSTDGSPQSGPPHKSMFSGMFFSCHHYPLCLLSSGCLMSAELQCAPVRYNLWQAICCVPWDLQFLENFFLFFSVFVAHIIHACFFCTVSGQVWQLTISTFCDLFCVQINWRITSPSFLDLKKCIVTKLKARLFFCSWSADNLEVHAFLWTAALAGLQWAVTSFVWYNKRKWMHSN